MCTSLHFWYLLVFMSWILHGSYTCRAAYSWWPSTSWSKWSFVLASGESAMIGSAHVGAAAQLGARLACVPGRRVGPARAAAPLGGGECGPVGDCVGITLGLSGSR